MITLIIEDGNVVQDANSYTDIQFVDDIAELEDEVTWLDCPEEDKVKAIVKATKLIDTLFGPKMRGELYDSSQSLLYPRGSFMDSNNRLIESKTIPNALLNATAHAAIGFVNEDINFVEDDFEDSNIKKESFNVGSGAFSESVEYFEKENKGSVSKQRVFKEIAPLLQLPSRQFSVVRG